jgi:hypothetical protein
VLAQLRPRQGARVAPAAQHARADQYRVHLRPRDVLHGGARLERPARVRIGDRATVGGERDVGDHVRAHAIVVLEPAAAQIRRQILRGESLLVLVIGGSAEPASPRRHGALAVSAAIW